MLIEKLQDSLSSLFSRKVSRKNDHRLQVGIIIKPAKPSKIDPQLGEIKIEVRLSTTTKTKF